MAQPAAAGRNNESFPRYRTRRWLELPTSGPSRFERWVGAIITPPLSCRRSWPSTRMRNHLNKNILTNPRTALKNSLPIRPSGEKNVFIIGEASRWRSVGPIERLAYRCANYSQGVTP